MSLQAKVALAVPLRTAVWNWIDLFPHEFHEVMRSNRRLEGAPERAFDGLWDPQALDMSSARALWPTLAVLSVISPERTVPDYFQLDSRMSMKNSAARVRCSSPLVLCGVLLTAGPSSYTSYRSAHIPIRRYGTSPSFACSTFVAELRARRAEARQRTSPSVGSHRTLCMTLWRSS
jgi:hypothetical protein